MTEFERLMLCICCGTSIGLIAGCWVVIIKDAIIQHRIKKRLAKEKDEQ